MIDALHKSQAPIWHEDAVLPSRDALRKESPCDSAAAAVSAASPDASVEKGWADTGEDTIKREEEGSRIGIAVGAGTDGRRGLGVSHPILRIKLNALNLRVPRDQSHT